MKYPIYLEALKDAVYIEYNDMDSETVSYSKAKELLRKLPENKEVAYALVNDDRALDFINDFSGGRVWSTIEKNGKRYIRRGQ